MRRYHPDDCPREYLDAAQVRAALSAVRSESAGAADKDALRLIEAHERIHRDVCQGRMTAEQAQKRIDALARAYLKEHGDWVHNRSKLYWRFYERLAKDGVAPQRG